MSSDVLAAWERSSFTAAGFTRECYRRGSGPGVIVVHEIPGITPKVIEFADDLVSAGMTVVMPSLVGAPGTDVSLPYLLSSMTKMCVAREFTSWALDRTSPIVAWLRALAHAVHAELGGPGVGAVGMCFSGGFALGMMVDDVMVAPVLSQPSLPSPVGGARARSVGLSPDDRQMVARRAEAGCQVLGLRFDQDPLVGPHRFDALRDLLGDAFIAIELPSSKRSDHSVLTEQRDDDSVQRVIDFLAERLLDGRARS